LRGSAPFPLSFSSFQLAVGRIPRSAEAMFSKYAGPGQTKTQTLL